MQRRTLAAIAAFLVLLFVVGACGPQATPTAVPAPTKRPTITRAPVTSTPTPLPGLPLAQEPFQSAANGYSIRYPQGWTYLQQDNLIVFLESPEVIQGVAYPARPIVIVNAGPQSSISGAVGQAKDAQEMIDAITQEMRSTWETFKLEEVLQSNKSGKTARLARVSGTKEGLAVYARIFCLHTGNWLISIIGTSVADTWPPFDSTYDTMLASLAFFQPVQPTATPQPTPPAGFGWRIGGLTDSKLDSVEGMDIGPDGNLYVAANTTGIQVISPDGQELPTLGKEDIKMAGDIKVASDGALYAADWAQQAIVVLSADGQMLRRWGQAGTGDGQFGEFSPKHLAVCPDGRVYAADWNKDAAGADYQRILAFDAQGSYLGGWSLTALDRFFDPSGMDCDGAGNLYVSTSVGSYVWVFSAKGEPLQKLGGGPLGGPHSLALGPDGNIYLGTWDKGALLLDPQGQVMAQWGVSAKIKDEGARAEGVFSYANAIAVDTAGNVYVGDYGGGYRYITKFLFP